MSLRSIFPVQELRQKFDNLIVLQKGKKDWQELCDLKPDSMHEIGMTIWDLVVTRGPDDVDPQALADSVQNADPKVAVKIKKILKKPVMFDLYCGRASIEIGEKDEKVAEVLAAHIYPNELHLADVEFRDPTKRIPKARRAYPLTRYRGLGLLTQLMGALEAEAATRGCTSITLTAATRDHVPLFAQYGFEVPETPRGRIGTLMGLGIPMVRWM